MDIYDAMLCSIKSEINGSDIGRDLDLSEAEMQQLFKLSQHHDLSHIVGNALIKNMILQRGTEIYNLFQKKIMLALYRYEKLNYEFNEILRLFEEKQIKFIPLKGAILRDLYPLPWMRTSCDIDILIEKENMDRATECLLEAGMKRSVESPHDITFITASDIHIELHYSLIEDEYVSNIDGVLDNVWERTKLHEGYSYRYDMNDEMFYFYHIAHMAKHFLFGGCGVKPFIDLWILDNHSDEVCAKRDELLQQGNLLSFANVARKLSKIWFDNGEYDPLSKQTENYILHGGVYGNAENCIIVQQQKRGGRIKYVLSKVFLPYNEIKCQYPILHKHRWLTPFMQVRRWFRLVFCGHLKRTAKEIKYNNSVSSADAASMQTFLENIGL